MEAVKASKNGTNNDSPRYLFDEFEIDPSNRTCTRGGEPITISGKVYDLLIAFVENPGRLLSKDELLELVWKDEFVEEGNLARNVSTLRKLLSDTDKQHRYIATVPGHGYRFVAEVRSASHARHAAFETLSSESGHLSTPNHLNTADAVRGPSEESKSRKVFWVLAALIVLFTVAWFGKDRLFTSSPTVRSLAVLPLRGIDPNDNYLGVGIADAVIRRISSSGQVMVRPTSAVLHYLNQDIDSLAAARELNTDAILEGNVQRAGDKLRVNVNLLKTSDGSSIWTDSFVLPSSDIFRAQDDVAEQVAERLKIRLAKPNASYPSRNPSSQLAYEWYLKGLYSLDQRLFDSADMEHMMETIGFFKRAIDIDPNYAVAHGQLAFSYAWMALFIDPDQPRWADLARQEITRAEELNPNVAEPHVAAGILYWGAYGEYNMELSIKELRLAKQLDPNFSGADLAAIYGHVGLEEQATVEYQRAVAIDPTSQALKGLSGILPYLRGDADGWFALGPEHPVEERELGPWYLLQKRSLGPAEKLITHRLNNPPSDTNLAILEALLFALKENFHDAEAKIPGALSSTSRNYEAYHHRTYFAACIFALEGKDDEAVKWLRETANTGFPNYPLFARDPFLDRIRQSPEFIQFLSEQKAQWERFEQEFPDA